MASSNPSIAHTVREHVAARPVLHEALRLGIVNHSALARRIAEEEGLGRADAVLKALTRLQHELGDAPADASEVQRALASCRLEVRTRVAMLTCEPSWQVLEALTKRAQAVADQDERIHILHGWDALTAVADESVLDDLRAAIPPAQVLEHRRGLAELNVRTADSLDHVPGFIAFVAGALSERGINVVDATTCRRDHIFLVDQEDLTEAIAAVESRVESSD